MEFKKYVDESWKESVKQEKELWTKSQQKQNDRGTPSSHDSQRSLQGGTSHEPQEEEPLEINFIRYITSLAFQSLVFLGEIPNPMAGNQIEKNLNQAKLLIDTLIIIREKTKGNLTQEEEDLLNSTVYELQVKYVEHYKNESKVNQ